MFVAHESLYEFFASHAHGRVVLDAGRGTGYGAHKVAKDGASHVLGLDVDSRTIAFARRSPNLAFRVDDIEQLTVPASSFDVVIASNSLEHLRAPVLFFRRLRDVLRPNGCAFVAVPPIYGAEDAAIHYHRSNLSVSEWAALIGQEGFALSGYIHKAQGSISPDVYSHRPSRLDATDLTNFCTFPSSVMARSEYHRRVSLNVGDITRPTRLWPKMTGAPDRRRPKTRCKNDQNGERTHAHPSSNSTGR